MKTQIDKIMPPNKNNAPFYEKGFSVMENGAVLQICNFGNKYESMK